MNHSELIEKIGQMLEGTQIEKPLTVEEAADFLNISKSTLYKLTHKRAIPFSKPNGKKLYFEKAKLAAWMLSRPAKTHEEIDEEASTYVTLKAG